MPQQGSHAAAKPAWRGEEALPPLAPGQLTRVLPGSALLILLASAGDGAGNLCPAQGDGPLALGTEGAFRLEPAEETGRLTQDA